MNLLVSRSGRKQKRRIVALSALLGLVAAACVYDPDNRCGPHEKLYGDQRCVCDETSALTATGCVPCGEHEVPGATGCVCAMGFTRPDAGSACQAAPAGLGTACSASMPCVDAVYNHCELGADQTGYCTTLGCTDASQCEGGYACHPASDSSPSFCQRPPVGLGKACTAPSDCEGGEATYCDSFQSHSCLVQGCSLSPDNCFAGWECCDLSAFGLPQPLCIPQGACVK